MYLPEPNGWMSEGGAGLLPREADLNHCWLAAAAAVLASKSLLPPRLPVLPSSMLGSIGPVRGTEPEPLLAICCRCCALLLGLLNAFAKPCHLPGLAWGPAASDDATGPLLEKLLSGLGTLHVAALTTGYWLD